MKTDNFTLRILLVLFFSIQTILLFSQTADLRLSPTGGGSFPIGSGFFPGTPPQIDYEGFYLYVPENTNTFSIREKSDFKFSYDRKFKSKDNSDGNSRYEPLDLNIQNFRLGYSPISYLYGTASLVLVNEPNGVSLLDSKMIQGDIGIGGYYLKEFKNIIKKENIFNKNAAFMMQQRGLLVNGLLGYSRGEITHDLTWTSGLGKYRINKFYGQVGFDFQARIWGFSGTAKVGVINYGTTYLERDATSELSESIYLLAGKNDFSFSELNFRLYVGTRFGQIYLKGMRSKIHEKLTKFTMPDYWSVGAMLDVQGVFKKRNKSEK